MTRLLILVLAGLSITACGLPPDIVGPTDPRSGPSERPPNPGG